MKKYKDLIVHCGSEENAILALVAIGNKCKDKLFRHSDEIENMYQANDKMIHILVELPETPQAIMLVFASGCNIKVLNVVPFNHSCNRIAKDVYNHIVDTFDQLVIRPLFEGKYDIECTKDELSMEEIIPKSFQALNHWANCPGAPHSPFAHQDDLEMWFEFLCQLHTNQEKLCSGDLEQWLSEDNSWDEDVVTDAIIRYETERDLLNYYDSHYGGLRYY